MFLMFLNVVTFTWFHIKILQNIFLLISLSLLKNMIAFYINLVGIVIKMYLYTFDTLLFFTYF